jgi:hypothetical protein
MCERGQDSSTPLPHRQPLPPRTPTNGSADRCHLSSVTALAFAHTKVVSIPCQLPYTRTPRTLAQYETAKSARLPVLDPNTILASRPRCPSWSTCWALLLPTSLSDSSYVVVLPPTSSSYRRLCTHAYGVRRRSGVRRALSSDSRLAVTSLMETCSRRACALRDWNREMDVLQA